MNVYQLGVRAYSILACFEGTISALGTPEKPTKKHPTHHKEPGYQNFSENIDPKQHKNHSGHNVALRWCLPQNSAGLTGETLGLAPI